MKVDRRDVLYLFAGFGLVLGLPFPRDRVEALKTRQADPLIGDLLQLWEHRESAGVIGTAYLQAYPAMGTSRALEMALRKRIRTLPERMSSHRLRQDLVARHLLEAVRADFSTGRTISLDGWVLSETEVQLCGLYALNTSEWLAQART